MSAYIGDVVKNGLVLYLDAANSKSYVSGSNTWFDLSGNNNSGSLTNGPTFSSENKGSIGFDGGDDLIEIPYTPSANITGLNLTLSCWIRASAVANSNAGAGLIVRGSGQNDGLYEMLLLPSGSKNYAFFRMYQVGNYWPKLTPIELNTYYHICCVYDNGTARNYINAVQEGTGSVMNSNIVGGSSAVINKLRVGNRFSDGTARFSGRMSQVQIYNRALSSAEILENYNATKGRFDTPIVINSVQPRLVTNGLVMCLDAGNRESYVSGSNIIYDLVPTRSTTICGTVGENNTLTLTAPPNYVFTSVDFASYGTPTGSCGSFTTSSCHSATSYTYVSSQLLGKTGSVSIGATNANFGDPCSGTLKRLYVQATATALLTTTGSLVNNPTFNSANGGILNFDGVDDFGSISCESFQSGNNAFSMESWFRWFGNGTNTSNFIFGYGSDTGQHRVPFITIISSKLLFEFGSNSGPVSSSTTIQTNTWYHGTAVYDKSTTKIYLNGVNENTTNYSSASIILSGSNGTNAGIGCLFSQSGNVVSAPRRYGTFNGSIGIVKYYNRGLSASEVLQNYNALKGRFGL